MYSIASIKESVARVKHKIPGQGPLEYFVHHNTLHHYEHLDFFKAITTASKDFEANAFMPEEYYFEQYKNQRISKDNIIYEIELFKSRYNLKLPSHNIYRLIIQKKTNNHCSNDKDIKEIRDLYVDEKISFYPSAIREDYGIEIDYIISSHILKFFAVYFDFGSAYWPMQNRDNGAWQNFINLYKKKYTFGGKFLNNLSINIIEFKSLNSSDALLLLFKKLKITNENYDNYLFELSCRYKGWLGFVKSLEEHPEWVQQDDIKPSFIDALAIIALCEYTAIVMINKELPAIPRSLNNYKHSYEFINHMLYEQAKNPNLYKEFVEATEYLVDDNRNKILHKAFEKTFYDGFFNVYALQSNVKNINDKYDYQIICCLDEREESFRRYLEDNKECQTFGTAGHFDLPIKFKGFFDKNTRALCPIVVKPEFTVTEEGTINSKSLIKSLFIFGELQWLDALNSKTMIRGVLQLFIGFFTKAIPFMLDIVSPALTYKIKYNFAKRINNSIKTKLNYSQHTINTGLSKEDKIKIVSGFLKNIGLINNFSRYIFIMGHGSSSLNNPHEAAYDCGACGGGRGGANARLMALILNEPEIRIALIEKYSINIPDNIIFIGAYHNTCSDNITFYDQDTIIENDTLNKIKYKIHHAAKLNAHERCRRFSSIVFNKSHDYYHKKVQQRSIDLRQPRPECGHATNAICVVGPRKFTKNLFLDRRSFLVSYDESIDSDNSILLNTLNGAIPVCAGINLEYMFSYIDNGVYGCGPKLPHNVISLVGVMNGYQSDLQLGLPWQMVELHEPIRLCLLVICKLSNMEKLLQLESNFRPLIKNRWILLSIHNTDDNKIYMYSNEKFIEYTPSDHPKTYFRLDQDIMNTPDHLDFGNII